MQIFLKKGENWSKTLIQIHSILTIYRFPRIKKKLEERIDHKPYTLIQGYLVYEIS